jgi:hypothetical protein
MSFYGPSTVIPVYSVLMAIGITLTGVRLWVRTHHMRGSLGRDDVLILVGVVIMTAVTGMQYYNATAGTGGEAVRDPATKSRMVVASRQMDWSMIVIEKTAFGAVKLSFLFFYRRIFGVWPSFRLANNILIWVVIAWTIAFTLSDILICGAHPELVWGFDQTVALQRCGNRGAALLSFAVTSVVTDLAVLALPLLYIGRLQMSTKKKRASAFVFVLGAA